MDKEEPLFVVKLTEDERMTVRDFPNENIDMDAANNTAAA
jgi:hypothetical protein